MRQCASSACFWSGPILAEGIMASGHAHRTNRSNTWPHRPTGSETSKAPCQGSAVHTWRVLNEREPLQMRFAPEAPMRLWIRRRGRDGSAPATLVVLKALNPLRQVEINTGLKGRFAHQPSCPPLELKLQAKAINQRADPVVLRKPLLVALQGRAADV